MKVVIAVTHLLGTGHLSRALTLARAFSAAGHEATVMTGGMPVTQLDTSGTTLFQLPALRSDGVNFTRLLTSASEVADETFLAQRQKAACEHLLRCAPDILLTELYPFGRRVLAAEFLALLKTAQSLPAPPVILASIRDILAPPSKMAKAKRADEVIAAYYDGVLIHSDPTTTRLETSWPVSDMLESKLHYTGYVAPPPPTPHPKGEGKGEVIVSAGGGSVGTALFETACDAARLMPAHVWRLLVGGGDAQKQIDALRQRNSPALIQHARPDFRQMLCHAAASVNMCGYNTAMDVLQSGVPSVMIPFDAGQEVEQTLRASSLASLPATALLPSRDLTAAELCARLEPLLSSPRRAVGRLNFDGARRAVEIACAMVGSR